MCEYLQEIWDDGLSIGEARGAHGMVKIIKSFCVPSEEMISRLMEELKLERVEAEKYVQGSLISLYMIITNERWCE